MDTLDLNEVNSIKEYIEKSIDDVSSISDDIVKGYTENLDSLMRYIKEDVIDNDNVPDSVLENYFMQLTNAMYFIGSKSEFLGLYEDFAKSNCKIKYNEAYSENQVQSALVGKKTTVDDNRLYAENKSINEAIVNAIYSRSFRIVKSKVDSANEMIKTLSKIISKRMNDKDYSDRFNSEGDMNEFR